MSVIREGERVWISKGMSFKKWKKIKNKEKQERNKEKWTLRKKSETNWNFINKRKKDWKEEENDIWEKNKIISKT